MREWRRRVKKQDWENKEKSKGGGGGREGRNATRGKKPESEGGAINRQT